MVLGVEQRLGCKVCRGIYVLDVKRHQAARHAEEHGIVVEWNKVAGWAEGYKLVVILSCCVSCSELRNYRLMTYVEMPLIMGRY